MKLKPNIELENALKRVFWDYNIDAKELVDIFYSNSSNSSINRFMIQTKLLNGLSWHNLVRIVGLNEAIKMLDDNVIKTIFPMTYRNSIKNAKRILSE
ncbi:MAG: hypothetical protein KIT33_10710 [Candidatus Kapabacteria bacterium]|nr:hypothetical protein [Ignavibacteriota bacterium]MCW5885431.1 hypothetical protein [Candidatus Kapabacteria bacterium]